MPLCLVSAIVALPFRIKLKDNPQLPLSVAAMFLFLAALVGIPSVASLLGFTLMDGYHWLIALALSVIPLAVAEYGKFWDNYKFHVAEKNRVAQQKI